MKSIRKKYKSRTLRLLPAAMLLFLFICGCNKFKQSKMAQPGWLGDADTTEAYEDEAPQVAEENKPTTDPAEYEKFDFDIPPLDLSGYDIKQGPRSCERIHINPLGRLSEVFNDSNKYHYAVAERLGISPIRTVRDAFFTSRPIMKIESCDYYEVAELTHSLPYLIPKAARLLSLIGRNFIDSLGSRGADGYRIMVTSLLRTPLTVKKLRRVNRNAVDSSTHQFATTFDISYTKFACADSTRTISQEDLKNLLAEVLMDLRKQNACLIKYERHTPCFHITVCE